MGGRPRRVVGDRSERRGMKAKRKGRNGGSQKGVSRRVGMGCTRGTACIVLGNDFVDSCRKLNKKVLFDVTATPRELGVEGACEKGNVVDKRDEASANTTERFDDTRNYGFALGGGVASEFILFS